MVGRNADQVKPPSQSSAGWRPGSAGWRPSRNRERLSPAIWIAGFLLAAAVIAVMAALFGTT
ncbi:hypothetical protein [Acidiphilium acidophilum]|uniref:Uncharacterized protein n=1 Tax=Acidiphilium acidophilum TaxID=76588 RepID=A0AAW9DTF8_ACIAO|nr:hypothetical protein [Acidiphilium acidophilum]MDX5932290.1 hypothetical protein [Acidiphilium acidophilum]